MTNPMKHPIFPVRNPPRLKMPRIRRARGWLARKILPRTDEWHSREQCSHGCCLQMGFLEDHLHYLIADSQLSDETHNIIVDLYNDLGK